MTVRSPRLALACLKQQDIHSSFQTASQKHAILRLRRHHRGLQAKAMRSTDRAHGIWKEVVESGDTVVDGTCGNGHDMVELCRLLSTGGRVVGFDVQSAAITATRRRLDETFDIEWRQTDNTYKGRGPNGLEVELVQTSHARLKDVVSEARVVCFNLGYLPGGNKNITTRVESTLEAVAAATEVMMPGGVVTVMTYPGHEEGVRERDALREMFEKLPSEKWWAVESRVLNRCAAPLLTTLYKLKIGE